MFKRNKKSTIMIAGALSAVALVGVGFSTWIVGIIQKEQTLDGINVEVNTVTDGTSILEMIKADNENGITLGEAKASNAGSNDIFQFEGDKIADLSVDLKSYSFAYAQSLDFDKITFTVEYIKDNAAVTDFANYIALESAEITKADLDTKFTKSTSEALKDYNYYTAKTNALNFVWGSEFGGKSPVTFYNEKAASATNLEEKLTLISEANTKLTKMKSDFEGVTIKVTATLSTVEKTTTK